MLQITMDSRHYKTLIKLAAHARVMHRLIAGGHILEDDTMTELAEAINSFRFITNLADDSREIENDIQEEIERIRNSNKVVDEYYTLYEDRLNEQDDWIKG